MSSLGKNYYRKRRSDDESSTSDSDEDAPPIKRLRSWNKKSNIKDAITSKLLNFVNWIYQLPVGYYERENMLKNSLDINVPIEIEDEEDIDVVEIDDDDDPVIEKVLTNNSDKSPRRENLLINSIITDPLSSSTPFLAYKTNCGRTIASLSRPPVNGCNSGKNYPTRDKRLSSPHQKLRSNRNIEPITNPLSDVEILLDTRETLDEESDDVEIVSEISDTKPTRKITRQTASPMASEFGQTTKECNGASPNSIMNGATAAGERRRSLNKSYTAHEVFRLQEKAHYQLILDKMIGTPAYRPVVPLKDPKTSDVEIDLTGDEPLSTSHFRKEALEKPVNEFLQKYYKPCQYKPIAPPKDPNEIEVFTVNDDVQIIEPEPIEYYRPKSKKRPEVFSTEWINEFKKVITSETEKRLQIVAAQEEKLERYRKRRDANIEKEKLLRGLSISSVQSEKDEFPDLTPEMEEKVDWAYHGGPGTEVLSTFKDCICNRVDMTTLNGLNWLNDSIMNFYLALLMERNKDHPVYPSVYAFNTFFYASLSLRGPQSVRRWTRKLDGKKTIFDFDILFAPIHLGMHWALCVIDNRTKAINYYDSMQSTDDSCLGILQNYLVFEKKDKLGITMDPNTYSIQKMKDIPQQMNGSDCGMFALKYAEYLSREAPITFSQENMQYFRRRVAVEILERKLF